MNIHKSKDIWDIQIIDKDPKILIVHLCKLFMPLGGVMTGLGGVTALWEGF